MRRLLSDLSHYYAVDVTCDAALVSFYRRLGFTPICGLAWRNVTALSDPGKSEPSSSH